jgi:cyclin H
MDYDKISHVSSWLFTADEIRGLRAKANREARIFIRTQALTSASDTSSTSTSTPKPNSFAKFHDISTSIDSNNISMNSEDDMITPEEETELINFYCSKLLNLIGPSATIHRLKRDIKVASTASLLLKRFYLSNSVICFDPKAIMVAAAFLAAKVEDSTCDIRYLEEGTKQLGAHVQIDEILKAEIELISGVDYDLWCLHPYKVVLAITEDLRGFLKSKEGIHCVNRQVSGEDLRPIYDLAREIVEKLVFESDIMLLKSPGKVGLAAMILANERLLKEGKENSGEDGNVIMDFKRYLTLRFADKNKLEIDALWSEINHFVDDVRDATLPKEVNLASLKAIHKKLKKNRAWGKDEEDKKKKKKKKRKKDDVDAEES